MHWSISSCMSCSLEQRSRSRGRYDQPAVTGTDKACSDANIKRAVVLSSVTAVMLNQNWPKSLPMDESCWSDKEYCKTSQVGDQVSLDVRHDVCVFLILGHYDLLSLRFVWC